jgi:hypothetical protein
MAVFSLWMMVALTSLVGVSVLIWVVQLFRTLDH